MSKVQVTLTDAELEVLLFSVGNLQLKASDAILIGDLLKKLNRAKEKVQKRVENKIEE